MLAIIGDLVNPFAVIYRVIGEMMLNPVLMFLLSASVIPVGIGIFRKLKRAAK